MTLQLSPGSTLISEGCLVTPDRNFLPEWAILLGLWEIVHAEASVKPPKSL